MSTSNRTKLLHLLGKQAQWQAQALQQVLQVELQRQADIRSSHNVWRERLEEGRSWVAQRLTPGAAFDPEIWLSYQAYAENALAEVQKFRSELENQMKIVDAAKEAVLKVQRRADRYEDLHDEAVRAGNQARCRLETNEIEDMVCRAMSECR